MSHGGGGGGGWAAVPTDLLYAVMELLENKDRLAAQDVCRRWAAALQAHPRQAPFVVLGGPAKRSFLHCLEDHHIVRDWEVPDIYHSDMLRSAALLDRASRVSPRRRRVRLEACVDRPDLVLGVLGLLPSGISDLELDAWLPKQALHMLCRFTQLQHLSILGSSADFDWPPASDGAPAWLPALRRLRLDYRSRTGERHLRRPREGWEPASLAAAAVALAGAPALHRLEVAAPWSEAVPRLCTSLPALRELSLELRQCHVRNQAQREASLEVVAGALRLLRQLSHLTGACLGVSTTAGGWFPGEIDEEAAIRRAPVDSWLQLPPLAGLTALTELRLQGEVLPPPDLRQLSALRRLVLDTPQPALGEEPLAGLAGLTQLGCSQRALPGAEELATAPALALVRVLAPDAAPNFYDAHMIMPSQGRTFYYDWPEAWAAAVQGLRPGVKIWYHNRVEGGSLPCGL